MEITFPRVKLDTSDLEGLADLAPEVALSEAVTLLNRLAEDPAISGTHDGEFFGVPGTGKRLEITGITIDRFDESGKMVEEWPEYDLLGGMRQLGAVPEPQQAES